VKVKGIPAKSTVYFQIVIQGVSERIKYLFTPLVKPA
jgi:hypothetical protein